MTHDHPNPNLQDDPSSSPLILGTVLGIVLTIVSIVSAAALYFHYESKLGKEVAAKSSGQPVLKLHAEQQNRLHAAAGWTADKKAVTVPIELAMKLVVKDFEGGKSPTPFIPTPASAPAGSTPAAPAKP